MLEQLLAHSESLTFYLFPLSDGFRSPAADHIEQHISLDELFDVIMEKTARELAGTPCLELSEADPPKQEICCSRMFGMRLTEIQPIKEAVVSYTQRAAEKL